MHWRSMSASSSCDAIAWFIEEIVIPLYQFFRWLAFKLREDFVRIVLVGQHDESVCTSRRLAPRSLSRSVAEQPAKNIEGDSEPCLVEVVMRAIRERWERVPSGARNLSGRIARHWR
jgi:hypothetical protein